jgi:hypothetical protein
VEAFCLANLIDGSGNWTGGSTTVVQVGNVLDRGNDEIKILYYLERLRRQADKTGGKVITMNSNHEIMNVESDFRYVDDLFILAVALLWFSFSFFYFIIMIFLD